MTKGPMNEILTAPTTTTTTTVTTDLESRKQQHYKLQNGHNNGVSNGKSTHFQNGIVKQKFKVIHI